MCLALVSCNTYLKDGVASYVLSPSSDDIVNYSKSCGSCTSNVYNEDIRYRIAERNNCVSRYYMQLLEVEITRVTEMYFHYLIFWGRKWWPDGLPLPKYVVAL